METIATIDNLDIQISVSAQKANQAIKELSNNIGTLATKLKFDTSSLEKLGNINGTNLKNLGVGVKTLSSGLKDLQGIKKSDFNRLAAGIERLASIQVGNMEAVGNALRPLAQGINVLSNAKFDNKNLTNLINSLTRLSNANTGSLANIDFSALGNSIKGLTNALSGAEKVQQNTISMTNAIAKLASAGANAGAVATALPELGNKLKEFMQTMSGAAKVEADTIAFTQAIGTLASAGNRAAATAKNFDILKDKVLSFINALAGAPNVNAGIIQLINSLAKLANAGSGANNFLNNFGNSGNRVSASTRVLKSSIDNLSKSMNGLKGSISGAFGGVKNFTKQVLAANGIMLGVYGAVQGFRKSIDISSQLTEVQNVVDVTFGDMAYKVEEFAQNSIQQFGMSELSVKQYASRFQAMGTAMGISSGSIEKANKFLNEQVGDYIGLSDSMSDVSLNLTKLTADMASLYNVEQDVVAEKLASVFTGQTRPLRDFGLDLTQATLQEWALKQGMDANIQTMSQAEKTMLRYQYVISNTVAAHKDFERTQLTWANQTRILKQNFEQLAGTIGGVFVNAIKPMVIALNTAMGYINSFAKTVANALGKIFGWTYEEGGGGLTQDFEGAEEGAEGLEDSTGKTAKNIDKMKKGLRVFDELKTIELPDPTDSSGGKSPSGNGELGTAGDGKLGKWKPGETIFKNFESEIDTLYKLGKYIGDALTETLEGIDWDSIYESARNFGKGLADFLNGLISPELFSALGDTVAGSINTALEFLDSFGKTFNFENFGKSIGSGINSALKGINWKTALSAAKKWGKGIAKAINGFVKTTDFSLVGSTVANALNTAIQFTLSMGKELDFKKVGLSIANGINGFFKTFKADKLAKTINVWVKGALEAVSTLLKTTDFEMIGQKIGTFLAELDILSMMGKFAQMLWEAIKAGFSLLGGLIQEAPIETALIAAFGLFKFTKLGSTIASSISTVLKFNISKVLSSPDGIILTIKNGLVGAVNLAKGAFGRLKNLFTNGDFFGSFGGTLTKIKDGLSNVRNKLTGMEKLGITAASGFAEFSVVSDSLENLTLGTGDFITEIGKIAGVATVAATGMYTALGPAGLAIAAITGVVAAIKGINTAMKKINAKLIGDAIHDALSTPGGVSISELTDGVVKSIGNIGNQFSTLSEKSNELDNAEKNIEDIKSQIQLVEEELKAGVITTEEANERLTGLLDELTNAIKTKLELSNAYIVAAFGEGGAWSDSLDNAGKSSEKFMGTVLGVSGETLRQVEELEKQMQGVEVGSPEWYNLYNEMLRVSGQMDELDKGITNFETEMSTLEIDYSGLLADEGELDPQQLEDMMSRVSKSVEDAQAAVEVSGKELVQNLTQKLQEAKSQGNQEAVKEIEAMIGEVEEGIVRKKKGITEQAKQLTDTLQSGLVDKIKQVGEDAYDAWDSMTSTEKKATGMTNATAYANELVRQYTEGVIQPFSDSVEATFSELGEEGAGWSGEAAKKASEAFTDYNWFENFGDNMSSKDFSDTVEGFISDATKGLKGYTKTKMKAVGKQAPAGMGEGVNDKLSLATGAVGNMANKMLSKARETLGVHSPSTKFKEIGGYIVEGMKGGIKDKWSNFSEFWKEKHDSILGRFKNIKENFLSKGKDIISGIKSGISGQWGGFEKDWAGKKKSIVDKFIGIKETFNTKGSNIVSGLQGGIGSKWGVFNSNWSQKKNGVVNKFNGIKAEFNTKGDNIVSGLEGGIRGKWGEFNTYWTGKKDSIVDKFKNINTTFNTKGSNIVSGLQGGIGSKWGTFISDWTEKKDDVVGKFDGVKDVFNASGEEMVSGLEGGIGSKWDGFVKGLEDKIKSMVNGIIHGINWVLEKLSVPESKWLKDWDGFATGSNGLPQDTIGIVNDQKGSTYKELIVPPHGKPFIPEGRNVMLPMEKGTKIMPARQTKDLMQKFNGFPHFAGGIGDFFKGAWAKITEFTGNVWDYLSHPEKILQIAMDKFTDLSGMLEPVLSIAKGAASTLLGGATDFIKKIFDEGMNVQYNPSKGVEQWRGLATKALQMTNQFTPANLNALLYRMNMESSGNPRAINLTDSNAKRGTPSKGLMQVIDPTFKTYAMDGFDKNIWDPLSNILASIRYTLAAYKGSLTAGWLKSGGYAKGIGKINIADLIPQYRAGGFPEQYSLFMAGEQGRAEMLGTVGGKTAVAGGEEITGIREEIRSSSSMEVQLLREQNQLLRAILEKPALRNDDVFNAAKSIYRREATRRYGDSAAFDPVWG